MEKNGGSEKKKNTVSKAPKKNRGEIGRVTAEAFCGKLL